MGHGHEMVNFGDPGVKEQGHMRMNTVYIWRPGGGINFYPFRSNRLFNWHILCVLTEARFGAWN